MSKELEEYKKEFAENMGFHGSDLKLLKVRELIANCRTIGMGNYVRMPIEDWSALTKESEVDNG